MIASISGKITRKGLDHLVVEASGLGYKVFVVNDILTGHNIDEDVKLVTQLIVREDSQTLYGFLKEGELEMFNMLLGVSGVGPKAALAILNAGKVEELRMNIGSGDSAMLTTVSGIGKKTAERIVLDLKSKVGEIVGNAGTSDSEDLIKALTGLGYNMYEVRQIISQVPTNIPTQIRIKEALKLLSK
ncbi:MAG: Holliday junction branch migration protein RuvA [Patescibacteria group bacterium]|nr:Holliday junction branch migration protein RuvA [Patescibacteria group bacterium]